MSPRRRVHESPRRFGDDDNLPLQGLTGIGIVTAATVLVSLVALVLAVVVSWIF